MERSADWMEQARRDLAHAKHAAAGAFYEWTCFSSQQAAEKAVKAALQRGGAEAWGHSVVGLLVELGSAHSVPADLLDIARELDQAYIPARYPNAHPSGSPGILYTRGQADRMVAYAERILAFCQGLLATP